MARKDNILNSFLNHPILESKYGIEKEKKHYTVREALKSEIPIITAIALIVDSLEKDLPASENELRTNIFQYLNTAI